MDRRAEQPESKDLGDKEIIIPRETAGALGRGLEELTKKNVVEINKLIQTLKSKQPQAEKNLIRIQESLNRFSKLLEDLQQSEEIKLTSLPQIDRYDFKFSGKKLTQDTDCLEPMQVIIDQSKTPSLQQLSSAMQHNFNNILTSLLVPAQLIQRKFKTDETNELSSYTQKLSNELKPVLEAKNQIIISTDVKANTIINADPINF